MAPRARSFSFVHAADLHLDTPFSGVHAVAPHVAEVLRDASLRAFDAVVELAIARDAAFVLVAGDVYDGAERGLRAQLRFRDGLQRLAEAGIAAFVVHGNHDPVDTGWSALGSVWPAGVTVFGTREVAVIPVVREGEQIATVQGISYARRDTVENLARRFVRPMGEGVHIGLLHCNVEGASGAHANYAPCTLADLRATRLDYLALGHVHERRILAEGTGPGDPWVVYPGNTQARSPRSSERGPKGAFVVDVNDGVIQPPEFVACDRVRFSEATLAIGDLADLGEVETELRDLGNEELRTADGRSVVLRVVLTGEGPVSADLSRPGALDELLAHLRGGAPADEPILWWDGLVDRSATTRDDAVAGDFAAELLDAAGALEDDGALTKVLAGLVAEAPRALQRALDDLLTDTDRRGELLAAARRTALIELGGGR